MDKKETILKGRFGSSLTRTNAEIRKERATSISMSAETIYRRKVEDLLMKRDNLILEQENLLDMSPTNATSLMVANDFNGEKFYERDRNITLELRDLNIEINALSERYSYLFGSSIFSAASETIAQEGE